MSNILSIKGSREAPVSQRSTMETLIISKEQIDKWRLPGFQRELKTNRHVLDIANEIRASGCEITGVITLGTIGKDPALYVVDGQHRLQAFRLSEIPEVIADVRIVHGESMADLAKEYVRLNTPLRRMSPDDILRGLESSSAALQSLRRDCKFIGYDNVRRNESSPILSMGLVVKCWHGSMFETPVANMAGKSAAQVSTEMDADSVQNLTRFLLAAYAAWGRDTEYRRLWLAVNLTLCMWLWRRLVIAANRTSGKRSVILTVAQFKQCLMALSANADYIDWLYGRTMGGRDRGPAYSKIKTIFVRRITQETGSKPMLPQPAWAS